MPRYVSVPTDATQHLIRQAYDAGGPYQWAREAWRNSDESGATRIVFDVERQAAERTGVLRRVIIDNGEGMEPDDMRTFLTTFGGGGKPIGVDSNFGQGFKSSVLPWNPYGVVVISYTRMTPEGSMLWIEKDPQGRFLLREWEIRDESGDVAVTNQVEPFDDQEHGCNWSLVKPDWLETGTIMVLLGDGPNANTVDGDPDPNRQETAKGLLRYLNSRLLDVPVREGKPVDTTIVILEQVKARTADRRSTKDSTITLPDQSILAVHQRKVRGMKSFIPTEAVTGPAITIDDHGTLLEWHYVPEPHSPVGGSADYIASKPVVVVDYQGEAYHADASIHRYRQFGVTDEIRGRTWIVIRPPVYSDQRPTKWGVLTQASRNILMTKGGGELPWEAWGNNFYNSFPKELADARDKARAKITANTDPNMAKNLSRILDRLNPRFKASRLVSSAIGKIAGFTTSAKAGTPGIRPVKVVPKTGGTPGGPGGTSGSQEIVTPSPGGPVKAKETSLRGGYPTFEWKAFEGDQRKYLADYNEKDSPRTEDGHTFQGVVYLNTKHPVFIQEINYWTDEVWPKADPSEVTRLVQDVYGQEAVAHVVHADRLNGSVVGRDDDGTIVRLGPEDVKELLSPASLTAGLLGLVNVEQRILTRGGGLFGSRANAS
ncbi:hypothetical protein [Lentzea sp. CC55]|uniref:hypothetical protein n=1 Tax=Lentzea sp. CC55 TaxID=2884909 RepID=UPI001F1E80E4|nr:hypothetical protein [Lentzea sp. CC55]MCG8921534.1 hypothetical protein [Lentzea sp. CC55]